METGQGPKKIQPMIVVKPRPSGKGSSRTDGQVTVRTKTIPRGRPECVLFYSHKENFSCDVYEQVQ